MWAARRSSQMFLATVLAGVENWRRPGWESPESAHTMDQVTIKRNELDSKGQLSAQSEQA